MPKFPRNELLKNIFLVGNFFRSALVKQSRGRHVGSRDHGKISVQDFAVAIIKMNRSIQFIFGSAS
jgi:hypothetical protein